MSARRVARTLVIAMACGVLGNAGVAPIVADEAYPIRPIKVIVPFSPGGSTDALARHIQAEIDRRQLLPQPMAIVNIEGAGSAIGSRRAKNAEPDGYTLMCLNEAIVTSKYWGSVEYGPEAFEPIASTGEQGTILTVRDDSPYRTLGDLLVDAKRRPGKVTAAVALGTPSHFACLGAQSALAGAELRHAQIGGGAHRFAALKGGHVDLTTFSTDEFQRFREEGLRGLAYLGRERNADMPEIPTALEQGYDVQRSIMLYWWAPKGTPPERLRVIGDALEQAMQGETLRERLAAASVEPVFLRGDELRRKLVQVEADAQSVDPRRQIRSPRTVLWTLVVMAALALWSVWEMMTSETSSKRAARIDAIHPSKSLGAAALTVAFVVWLSSGMAPLWASIGGFMLSCGAWLGGLRTRGMAVALLLLTVALSAGFHYLFTYLFVVDF
ncbi:MAG: tripartite tricarboxylate transporter substrate binding protein [Planctomycetales bacterium]|nr:tripartite tricarboxylate transporter substrate binding protein [Planctomycetales bacterium]